MSIPSAESNRIRTVAAILQGAPSNRENLQRANQLIDEGYGTALFDVLMDEVTRQAGARSNPVSRAMSLLETIVDTNPQVSGYLMAKLYPLAGRTRNHETYNAIELWMHSMASSEIADLLQLLAAEAVRPKLRARYEEWARTIKQNAKSRIASAASTGLPSPASSDEDEDG